MKFDNIAMARKLWGVLLGLLLALFGLALGLLVYMDQINSAVEKDTRESEARISLVLHWQDLSALSAERAVVAVISADDKISQQMAALVQSGIEEVNGLQQKVTAAVSTAEGKQQLAGIAVDRAAVVQSITEAQEVRKRGDLEAAQATVAQKIRPAMAKYEAAIDSFLRLQEQRRDEVRQAGADQRTAAYWTSAGLAAGLFVLAMVAIAALVRSITHPLQRAVGLANAITEGDLTSEIHDDRKDELGHLLRSLSAMAARLRGVVGDVRSGVESVSSASTQIAMGNQDLSARTEQTAANLEETAASMEELTATVTQSADTARQANQLAANAAQAATRGGAVVGQVVSTMQHISDSSRKIADIIGVIDSIAFQTNILALNAAVEAARAGEQGRGFAVVASEVRSLAGRSAEAAKEIKALIGASVQNVESGSQQVAQAGQSMSDIVTSVQRVSDLIAEITASSTEQRDGISQVNQAVTNLDQMTQQNAALVEESSAAATAMRDQAQHLAQVMSMFNVGTDTRPGNAPSAAARAPVRRPLASAAAPSMAAAKHRVSTAKPAAAAVGSSAGAGAATGAGLGAGTRPGTPAGTSGSAPSGAAAPRLSAAAKAAPRQSSMASEEDWESF